MNIKSINNFNTKEIAEDIPYNEDFGKIELYIDLKNILKYKNDKQKCIIDYIVSHGLSDREIASNLGVSRQFVNKIKKKILKDYFS